MSSRNYYQELFDLLQPYLPAGWKRAVLYAEYGIASYSIEFFVKTASGKYVKCFDLPGVDEEALDDTFDEMNEVYSVFRAELPGSSLWSNATIAINASGKMDADFDYTDLQESGYSYKQTWKAKYLI
ncbi:MAG: DUF600 family protein [Coriobacteriia bacterium]|nr:DUF600 family protein [Coriobacteriia bacterium]